MRRRTAAALAALLVWPAALGLCAFWRRREPERAAWRGPFTPDEYRAFLSLIGLYFGVRKLPITVREGELTVEAPDGVWREHLGELAGLCHAEPRERWPEVIARHFGKETRVAPAAPAPVAAAPPVWTPPAAAEAPARGEWAEFRAMVQEVFLRYGFDATVGPDGVVARGAGGCVERFEAPGLERGPLELPRQEWARFVDACFGEPLRALRGNEALAGRAYEEVRDLLALQLFDEMWLSAQACRESVGARDLPGLLTALVCRLPQATFRVAPEAVAAWGREQAEVMAAARANLRSLRPPLERLMLAPGAEGMRFESRGPFGAAQALALGDLPECSGPFGALVAVPRRELLLVCPLRAGPRAAQVARAAAVALVARIRQSEWEGHTALSRRLYWYHGGEFEELPYEVPTVDGKPVIELTPAGAFAAALAEMEAGA